MATTTTTPFDPPPHHPKTFAHQSKLPKLPIPPLEDTCKRYLRALEALQSPEEHEETKLAVRQFLEDPHQGPRIQAKLQKWAAEKDSYIEDFWYESYLSHSDPVVLALNPFFVLEDDPTPARGSQLPRAAALITSALGFIHDLRAELLEPDTVRGVPLDMDQYTRLFGTARIPTQRGCRMQVSRDASHIVVLRRGQFYWFDVLDGSNRPLLTERELMRNLQAIASDADHTPPADFARAAVGVLSTENRKVWSGLRERLRTDAQNRACLQVVDNALFVVCLDDKAPADLAQLCDNFLCGTYDLRNGVQVGTCMNRWYDKLQIIVCADGSAGINFEHTGVDGHTVLRFAADIFTDGLMLLARSINPTAPTLFHAPLSPYAKSYKPPKNKVANAKSPPSESPSKALPHRHQLEFDTAPKKLEWVLGPELRAGIRFAETRLSDLICQNDCQALEFKGYGKVFITSHGFSPDAFVQLAFQAAYYGLYGRTECTYEPAMTKAFLHGRTEAIRTVGKESVEFTKTFFSDAPPAEKIAALRKACERHVALTRECAKGLGQDRHLYALYCLLQRELRGESLDPTPNPTPKSNGLQVNGNVEGNSNANANSTEGPAQPESESPPSPPRSPTRASLKTLPDLFTDPGYALLSTSVLSTSNCGNPALRLFGFGPVAADGFGIGYIVKDDGLSVCAASRHLQTRRLLETLASYLREVRELLVSVHREANASPEPFVDHAGVLRDARTGRRIHGGGGGVEGRAAAGAGSGGRMNNFGAGSDDNASEQADEDDPLTGYSFFDSGDISMLGRSTRRNSRSHVGKVIPMAEY